MIRKYIIPSVVVATFLLITAVASAENVIKIGTMAPQQSAWGQVLNVWASAVKERSGGQLNLRFYWNGVVGDEINMVGKMKSGQIDGAAVTAVGLARIHKPILALQLPGIFAGWSDLDAARDAVQADFRAAAEAKGFSVVGWGDVGRVRAMSKGFAVTGPQSLRSRRPFVGREDDVGRALYQVIGATGAVPITSTELLPLLDTGAIDSGFAPALISEQMQWAARFDHVSPDSYSMMIGALVITDSTMKSLPTEQRAILAETGKVAAKALTQRIRREDDAAFGRMSRTKNVHANTPDERAQWRGVFADVRRRLIEQGVFDAALVRRLESLGRGGL